ncbi:MULTISPECIES: 2Fe-2S iron-sulfur cluster-binding protein [unclassified Paenibacillus]|uniref:2Fe-2S iron-sulfur cluster-binding protein n=1 Tax=unclassified Paenibacillus TaxID=185978 RepID=UPI00104F74E4|nr:MULTISPECIES: 2Fe-2S iron-sulfur cluster-binding protein [unclassified Paenibacillus]NIK67703.1 2Fe-2S ferredoxin [Paenibacillus sp. BK720]TCN01744.1 2Fe-2S ferredoxin [Paenibacillus sp. BK033]
MSGRITFWPSGTTIEVKPGTPILSAARRAGVLIQTRCGGNAACFMCKVKILPESDLMPIAEEEKRKLAGLEEEGYRLACQAKVRGVVQVDVPLDPLRAAVQKLLAKQAEEKDELW